MRDFKNSVANRLRFIGEVVASMFEITAVIVVSLIPLLIFYGILLLIFRHAFGIELPNPFDLLPTEWREKLPTVSKSS